MRIKTIPRSLFDQLMPRNFAVESLMGEEVEWFSNTSGNMLGTIGKGESVAGWNYAIFRRDLKGDFHVRKVMGNLFDLEDARVDLRLSMVEFEEPLSIRKVPNFCRE